MFLGLIFVVIVFMIGLALFSLALVMAFGGATIPFIAIGMSQRDEIKTEKAKEYAESPVSDGRHDWYVKLRDMHLGVQTGEQAAALDPDHSPEILD